MMFEAHFIVEHDWPNGTVVREMLASEDKKDSAAWRSSKWVWRSNGNTVYGEAGVVAARTRCQGVICCTGCNFVVRPKTDNKAENPSGIACPNIRCRNPNLRPMSCRAFTLRYTIVRPTDGAQIVRWHHFGNHEHPRPPAGRLSKQEERALDIQVAMHPGATAHALSEANTFPTSVPLAQINPVLADPRRARYQVDKSRSRVGLGTSGSKRLSHAAVFESFSELEKKHEERIFVGSQVTRPTYLAMQTAFMKLIVKEAVADWLECPDEGPIASRHGSITDSDHTYFREGKLIVTTMFNLPMNCWIPVLQTWIPNEDTDSYRAHFRLLFQSILDAAGDKFQRFMLSGVRLICFCI